ncbi:MAG TPA: V-type ATP synthase subunit D [bacterium]|nr:V-type ATP synthase subunit D [bacterium]
MAKLALNKTALKRERDQLQLCNRVLPPLDMKRRQLTAELRRARAALAAEQDRYAEALAQARAQLPMLAHGTPELAGLVRLQGVRTVEQNLVGVRLPMLEGVDFAVSDYALLTSQPWLELYVERIQAAVTLRARLAVDEERVRRLDRAVRRVTQRVNLFEKVLIPTIRRNIRRIQAFLADAERAAVVRSKIAKAMHARVPAEAVGGIP